MRSLAATSSIALQGGSCLLLAACVSSCATSPSAPWEAFLDCTARDPMLGWQATPFGGQGELEFSQDTLLLHAGYPMTGITRTGSLPQIPFEMELVCRRKLGNDFFCGLTFPVQQGHLSLILGGWGGATCGLSNLDEEDASRNESTFYLWTPPEQTMHVRLVVEAEGLRVWLDGELRLTQNLKGVRCEVRPEMLPCLPLGFACFSTRAELDHMRVRPFVQGS